MHKHLSRLALLPLLLLTAAPAQAGALEDLAMEGYAVVAEYSLEDFEGCEFGLPINLAGDGIFECREYTYEYGYDSEFLVLQHVRDGDLKAVINDDEVSGVFYPPQ